MSKCKPQLDGDKITEIRVKTKTQACQVQGKSEPKNSDKPSGDSNAKQKFE